MVRGRETDVCSRLISLNKETEANTTKILPIARGQI
jgi:hypothetical protein